MLTQLTCLPARCRQAYNGCMPVQPTDPPAGKHHGSVFRGKRKSGSAGNLSERTSAGAAEITSAPLFSLRDTIRYGGSQPREARDCTRRPLAGWCRPEGSEPVSAQMAYPTGR